jgi:6-phosphogluconolactonase
VIERRVLDDPAGELADLLADAARAGRHIVLTGGSSPRQAYRLAAEREADWGAARVWFGDERCVPPDHPDSNYGMAHAALLSRVTVEPEVHRMPGELGPDAGAGTYEAEVREHLGSEPRWGLLLLGLGPDAHCASLFPGKPEVEERRRLVAGVPVAGMAPQVPRITMTLPCLNGARHVVFIVTGADKADAVVRAFGPDPDPTSPAAHVRPSAGTLTVLLDEAAAHKLPGDS